MISETSSLKGLSLRACLFPPMAIKQKSGLIEGKSMLTPSYRLPTPWRNHYFKSGKGVFMS